MDSYLNSGHCEMVGKYIDSYANHNLAGGGDDFGVHVTCTFHLVGLTFDMSFVVTESTDNSRTKRVGDRGGDGQADLQVVPYRRKTGNLAVSETTNTIRRLNWGMLIILL